MFKGDPTMQELMSKYDDRTSGRIGVRHVRGYTNSVEENLMLMQFDYIKDKALKGESFVVVGRCAEYILKDFPNLISIFVCAKEYDRQGLWKENKNL